MSMARLTLIAATLFGGAMGACAQPHYTWQVYDMHSAGARDSEGFGVSRAGASGNIGWSIQPERSGASLWMGSEAMWLLLAEEESIYLPGIRGADADKQCGYDTPDDRAFAALWFGTRDSVVHLHPGDPYYVSEVRDVFGDMAVGNAALRGRDHAAVWTAGDPPVMVDLHYGSANNSYARATDGRWQGGSSGLSAVLWKGTPESMVVMEPPGYCCGPINGMALNPDGTGTQVGTLMTRDQFDNLRDHAVLWHDTPESWIDMHPPSSPGTNSYMWGTTGTIHCGQVSGRARIWFGDDPDSFLDIHQFIDPPPTGASRAVDIDVYDGQIHIAGRATYEIDGRVVTHAIVWIGTPEGGRPGGAAAVPGGPEAPKPALKPARPAAPAGRGVD
ncbi:MAG: hypothetical protein ACF8R9_11040 [Phycisphaerales bacterium JB054]